MPQRVKFVHNMMTPQFLHSFASFRIVDRRLSSENSIPSALALYTPFKVKHGFILPVACVASSLREGGGGVGEAQ